MSAPRWFKAAANVFGGGLFLTLFITFVIQIVARFGFNKPLAWTDEMAVILYIWVIMWAASTMVSEREHVVFDLVWNGVGRRSRMAMKLIGNLMIGGLSLVAIPACWDYVSFMGREGTPVLGIPFTWVFVPIVLLLVTLVVRAVIEIWAALHGRGLEVDLHT